MIGSLVAVAAAQTLSAGQTVTLEHNHGPIYGSRSWNSGLTDEQRKAKRAAKKAERNRKRDQRRKQRR